MMFLQNHGLILSCDVRTLSELDHLVEISHDKELVVGYKIGFTLVIRYGLDRVTDVIRDTTSFPVIYDHQKGGTDIPVMGTPFMEVVEDCGAEGVILFPLTGLNTLKTWTIAAVEEGLVPIVGGMMTHEGYLENESGFLVSNAPKRIYREAALLGVDYFVLPGNRPQVVKEIADTCFYARQMSILMPGIGAQGGNIQEAFTACGVHRPYAIVGSDIYKAPDPVERLGWYLDEIKRWEDAQ